MRESNLFEPVKNLLEKKMFCEVHAEVADYDVVGVGKGYEILVELKTSMSLQLLDQATDRVGIADYIFVAIPIRKRPISHSAIKYLNHIGVGLMQVDGQKATVIKWGRKHKTKRSLKRFLNETTKSSVGGVPTKKMISPYKITIENIRVFLRRFYENNGWATVDQILQHVESHYSNPKPSVMQTLQKEWNADWIETKKDCGKRYFRYKNHKTKELKN